MAKKRSTASLVRGLRAKKSEKNIQDSSIDFSDIPEMTDAQLKQMKRPGRPLMGMEKRQLIAIRIDPATLIRLKKVAEKKGKGYQTLVNEILTSYVKNRAA